MRIKIVWLVLLFSFILASLGGAAAEVYFEMKDPLGDEYGYGSYRYPSNVAFQPYQGLFDITEFKVWSEKPGIIYFDTSFAKITNPWMAPEGFIHQNLRILVDSIPDRGQTELPKKGAYVSFNPKYGWDFCLKVVGWGNSQVLIDANGSLKQHPLKAEKLADNRTIRASVPESLIGTPNRKWKYYVLVGSFDGFGEDFFRKVKKDHGEWVIGGGSDQTIEPQVLDILAYASGGHNQAKQLKSFDINRGKLATLDPVGHGFSGMNLLGWIGKFLVLVGLTGLGYGIYQLTGKRQKVFWFWVKQPELREKR
ncbi:MAG: glucodextranase DOMON-like domain-containing protein [Bacteroidota bacterium]